MMRRSMRALAALLATVTIGGTAGCSLDPTRLPVPGAYTPRHAYHIKIEFASVLNLPARAKVDAGGVQIGVLDPKGLPVAGRETAQKLLDETLPSNTLMARWKDSENK